MPSMRAFIDREKVFNKMTPGSRANLSRTLREKVAQYLRLQNADSVAFIWIAYDDSDNELEFTLDLVFDVEGYGGDEAITFEFKSELRTAMLDELYISPDLPGNIDCGMWIHILHEAVWSQVHRGNDPVS